MRKTVKNEILLKEGEEPLTEKVADAIGCVNDEMCLAHWDWRRCHGCIGKAREVIEIVKADFGNDGSKHTI